MRKLAVATVVLGLLAGVAGCGSGQPGRPPAGDVAAVRQAPADPPLVGTEWRLTGVVEPSRTWSPPPELDAVLRLDGRGNLSASACNSYGGRVAIDGDLLRPGVMTGTLVGCSGADAAVEAALVAVLAGQVRWAIVGGELRLDRPDGHGLRYRPKDPIYPSPQLRSLRTGRHGGGDYRYGWRADGGLRSLEWVWREGPGRPWQLAGMSRESTWPVPRPDVLAGSAGADRFVFGVVPPATARARWQPPGGRPAVPLELYSVPGARSWRAVGGFVDRRGRGVVVALDARGRGLGRSLPL